MAIDLSQEFEAPKPDLVDAPAAPKGGPVNLAEEFEAPQAINLADEFTAPATPAPSMSRWEDFQRRTLAGVASGIGKVVGALDRPTPAWVPQDNPADTVADAAAREKIRAVKAKFDRNAAIYAGDPAYEGTKLSTAADIAGQVLPVLATGPAAPVVGGMQMSGAALERARAEGKTEAEQARSADINLIGGAALNLVGVPGMKLAGRKIDTAVEKIASQGTREAVRRGGRALTGMAIGGGVNAAGGAALEKIDTGAVDLRNLLQQTIMGAGIGVIQSGAIGGRSTSAQQGSRDFALRKIRAEIPEFKAFKGDDNALIRAVHAKLAAEDAAARAARVKNVTPETTESAVVNRGEMGAVDKAPEAAKLVTINPETLNAERSTLNAQVKPEVEAANQANQAIAQSAEPAGMQLESPVVKPLLPLPESTEVEFLGNREQVLQGSGAPVPQWQVKFAGEDRGRTMTAEALAREGWMAPEVKKPEALNPSTSSGLASAQVEAAPAASAVATPPNAAPALPAEIGMGSEVAPAVSGAVEPTAPAASSKRKGRGFSFSPRADGVTDIIDAIQDLGGVPQRPAGHTGGEWNGHDETFKGTARLLLKPRKKGEGKIDTWIKDELAAAYPEYQYLAGDPDGFRQAVVDALADRARLKITTKIEMATADFQAAALDGTGRPGKLRTDAPREIDAAVHKGDEFKIKREPVKVIDKDPVTGDVIVQDGPRYGTQELPGGAELHADKGSYKPAVNASEANQAFAQAGDEAAALNEPVAPLGIEPVEQQLAEAMAKGPTLADDLLGDAMPFNLANQSGQDFAGHMDRQAEIAAARAAQERAQSSMDFAAQPGSELGDGGAGAATEATTTGAEYGLPSIPAAAKPGSLETGRMTVSMERILPGQVSVPQVMEALRDVLRVLGHAAPIRSGHFNARKARGVYKPFENVIRLKRGREDNIPTAAHEVGHALSKQVWGSAGSKALRQAMRANPRRAAVVRELDELGHKLYGNTRPAAGYTAEGFAELTRLWLTTEKAPFEAPEATRWLEQVVLGNDPTKGNPLIGDAMRAARDKIDIWRGQGALARQKAQTVTIPHVLLQKLKSVAAKFTKEAALEEFDPFRQLSMAYREAAGKRLPAHEDPYLLASAKRGAAGSVLQNMVLNGMVDVWGRPTGGPSLRETVARIKPRDADNFRAYGHARMAIEAWKEGKNPGMAVEDAVNIRDMMEAAHPEFIDAVQKRHEWWDALLQYKRDASPGMNGKTIDAIRAKGRLYFGPMNRDMTAKESRTSAASGGVGSGLHRFHGSGLPVKQIDQQGLLVAQGIVAGAHWDMILDAVVNLSKHEGMGHLVERLPRAKVMEQVPLGKIRERLEALGMDTSGIDDGELIEYVSPADSPKGSDPIIVREGLGGPEWYQVPAEIADLLEGVEVPARLSWEFELLLGGPSRLTKLGITGLRPAFALANTIRDFPTMLIQGTGGNPAALAAAWLRAQGALVRALVGGKRSELMEIYEQLGISGGNFLGGDIQHARREATALYHGKKFRLVQAPLESLRELIGFTEAGPRMGEMELVLREMGWKPGTRLTPEQAIAATVAAKRVTVDFSAKGREWEGVRRAIMFWGPAVQGLRTLGRSFSNEKDFKRVNHAALKTLLKITTVLTLPALANWWRNKDEEWYRQLPWRERWNYLNVEKNGTVYQIPLPQEFGAAFVAVPVAALESWYNQDPESVKSALGHLFDVVNPADWPTLVKAGKEQWQNRIDFFDKPIVPRGEVDLMPGMQRGTYTSWLAKALGDIYPEQVSPRRVDAAIRSVFGGVGSDVVDAPEAFMRALGLTPAKPRQWELSDLPVVGRIARRGGTFTANNQYLVDFWDDFNRYSAWSESNRKAMQAGEKPLRPMQMYDQAYAARLKMAQPALAMLLHVAAREPDLAKRQKAYREAANFARSFTASRPKLSRDK